MSEFLQVVCPSCDAVNRVPRAKLAAGGRCGACHQALFDGHPLALDAARFERHVQKSDLPLLIDFWAPWCAPCRAMAPEFERAARQLEPQVRLVKINVDEAQAVAARFDIRSIPTIALVAKAHEIARTAGAMAAPDLARWVEGHRSAFAA
jgi:thioredoxin 2